MNTTPTDDPPPDAAIDDHDPASAHDGGDGPSRTEARDRRLLGGLSQLRTRTDAVIDGERLLFILGSILVPLGFLLVGIGWYGASDTGVVFEQIPYVLSGGFVGLGLIISGGFLYLAWWLTRQTREAREHHAAATAQRQAMADLHQEMLTELAALRGDLQAAAKPRRAPRTPKADNAGRSSQAKK